MLIIDYKSYSEQKSMYNSPFDEAVCFPVCTRYSFSQNPHMYPAFKENILLAFDIEVRP